MTFFVGENWEVMGKVFAAALFDGTNVGDVIMAVFTKVKSSLHLKKTKIQMVNNHPKGKTRPHFYSLIIDKLSPHDFCSFFFISNLPVPVLRHPLLYLISRLSNEEALSSILDSGSLTRVDGDVGVHPIITLGFDRNQQQLQLGEAHFSRLATMCVFVCGLGSRNQKDHISVDTRWSLASQYE